MITDMILEIDGSLPGLASFACTNSLGRLSNRIRYNNFRKLKSKQKKTWFAALW